MAQMAQGTASVRFVASALGAAVAEWVTLPADVAKTRLQIQTTSDDEEVRYHGIVDCVMKVGRVEGVRALWKGLVPALIRQVCYHSFTFVLYEPIKSLTVLPGQEGLPPTYLQRLFSGGLAAGIAIAIFNPTEVMKTQMQASAGSSSMREVYRKVWSKDGMRGFWAGVRPNIVRTFLVNGAEIGTYDEAKAAVAILVGEGVVGKVMASGIAGLISACVATPADVVKTRLMHAAGSGEASRGITATTAMIIRKEGFRALYKGFTLIVIRRMIWCMVFFVIYEHLLNLLTEATQLEDVRFGNRTAR